MRRILLLMSTRTYRSRAFMRAVARLRGEVVVGTERAQALARLTPGTTLTIDLARPERSLDRIAEAARSHPFDAVVGVDDDTTLLAALAGEALGLPHNAPDAVRATRDKHLLRRLLADAGLPSPAFTLLPLAEADSFAYDALPYPCVLKPLSLSASRGVIRADSPAEARAAVERIRRILAAPDLADLPDEARSHLLVEAFIPGAEVAVEAMLAGGRLQPLALFDKPDPLDGPFFEETIYVTPSRLSAEQQTQIVATTARAAAALGLREGPVHAELRVNDGGAWVVEIAGRSIGGLCSSALEFSGGATLEELILRHAAGEDIATVERAAEPSGVMMIPIPRAGGLAGVAGLTEAKAVAGVTEIEISIPRGDRVEPLPEGNRYLGFIFARGATPAAVEAALRAAHERLQFEIT